jgi:hypothetical protein
MVAKPNLRAQLLVIHVRKRVLYLHAVTDSIPAENKIHSLRALERAAVVEVASAPLRVLGVLDLLEHKIALLSRASVAIPVDQKHYADAKRLGAICGRTVPSLAPSQLTRSIHSQDVNEHCLRCEASRRADFPLASKQLIFDVLGYV